MSPRHPKRFASEKPRALKRRAGRTPVSETPLRIRVAGLELTPEIEERTRALLGRRLVRFGPLIERANVRFKDINGPARGGPDTRCRIHLTVSGRPTVFVEELALDADRALSLAAASVTRALTRSVERRGIPTPRPSRPAQEAPAPSPSIQRRKRAAPAADERRPRRRGMVYVQEGSAGRPSRKSTRKSANRMKGGSKLSRRTQRRKHAPKARAARARRQRQRSRIGR
jgi:hypothetical protein